MFDFGQRLKDIRKEKNLTQKQLADMINKTDRAIQKYETGEIEPTLSVLIAILEKVDISADYLLGRTDKSDANKS